MSKFNFSIPLGSVDLDVLKTDEDFQREARRVLPEALTQIGEKAAEVAWKELQKGLGGIPGIKLNSSSSDRSRFIRETGQKHRRSASVQERRELEEHIIQKLRELKHKTE